MSMEVIKAVTGMRRTSNNVEADIRSGPFSDLIVNDSGAGRYFEMVRYGLVFSTFVKAVTVAATHNSPISANTATPVIGFGNISTNKAAVLLRAAFLTTSGTPAGGQAVLNVQSGGALPITAAATGNIFNHLVQGGISQQGSLMKPWNNVALGGWLATPNPVQEMTMLGGAAAAAAAGNGGPGVVGEDLGGLFIIPPGGLCAIMAGSGAGTTWIVNASLTWLETDWPL
jgi:hypothetical protein